MFLRGKVRRAEKPKAYCLHHTWERSWPIGNRSQLKTMCSVATILMNRPIMVNNLSNVILINSLNYCFLCHLTLNVLLQITKQLLFQVLTVSFLCTGKLCWTLDEQHGDAISSLAKALQQFLYRKPRCWAILEKSDRKLNVVCSFALNYMHFYTILLPNNCVCDIYG